MYSARVEYGVPEQSETPVTSAGVEVVLISAHSGRIDQIDGTLSREIRPASKCNGVENQRQRTLKTACIVLERSIVTESLPVRCRVRLRPA